jgi:hypothetical protein
MALIGWVIEVFFVLVLQKRERKKRTLLLGQKVRLREAGAGSY